MNKKYKFLENINFPSDIKKLSQSELKILDSQLRSVKQLFNKPKHLLNAASITHMDNKKLYSLHNNPAMVKVFNPRLTLLQSKISLRKK